MPTKARERIAVLGGGVGALSAAFYLTEQAGWSDKYEITVYQQGWRLGGKCASGRDTRPGYGDRIYEHGLHIFAGFYDQSFDLLRRAYEVLERPNDHPNQMVWDAFLPQDGITLVDKDPNNLNYVWYMNFPVNGDVPGDDLSTAPLIVMIQRMVGTLLSNSPGAFRATRPGSKTGQSEGAEGFLEATFNRLSDFVQQAADDLKEIAAEFVLNQLLRLLDEHITALHGQAWSADEKLDIDRMLLSAYLVQTILHGIAADNVIANGYDYLDKYEWSEWLFDNAVDVAKRQPQSWGDPVARAKRLLAWAPIASLYDYVFGFGNSGDTNLPSFAAGTALRSALLMISYKGHFFWKMRGAMGDVVIAPLYLALVKRGVKFKFFSRITSLNIDPQAARVASIDYVQQVPVKDAEAGYQPLIHVPIPGWPSDHPLECWPAEPLWDQIADAAKAKSRDLEGEHNGAPGPGDVARQLKVGVDFDKIVLGISVGGLKQVCETFPARLPQSKWGPMFGALTLTRTCAMQIWLTRTQADLGSQGVDRTLTGAEQPYSSWSDMSHLLSRETWRGDDVPRSVVYWCGQITGPENGQPANQKAYDQAVKWLAGNSEKFWLKATSPASAYGFDPKLIHDPDPSAGGDVLTRQYIRTNSAPSDLYVQSPKNSVYTRMDANESGLINLFLTGDWTRNGLNSGCAEAAARSGSRCALAIAGKLPPLPS